MLANSYREPMRVVAARTAVTVAASVLALAAMSAGTAHAAFSIVLNKATVEVGDVLVVRVPGARPRPNKPSMAIVVSRTADPRRFGRWPQPAVLQAGSVRLKVAFGPERMYPKGRDAPVDLTFLGYVRFDSQGNALLRVRVPTLARGSYTTFLYCPQCGPSLIPGPRLRVR